MRACCLRTDEAENSRGKRRKLVFFLFFFFFFIYYFSSFFNFSAYAITMYEAEEERKKKTVGQTWRASKPLRKMLSTQTLMAANCEMRHGHLIGGDRASLLTHRCILAVRRVALNAIACWRYISAQLFATISNAVFRCRRCSSFHRMECAADHL